MSANHTSTRPHAASARGEPESEHSELRQLAAKSSLGAQPAPTASPLDPAELFASLPSADLHAPANDTVLLLDVPDPIGDQPLDPSRFRRPTSFPPPAPSTSQVPGGSVRRARPNRGLRGLALAATLAIALAAVWLLVTRTPSWASRAVGLEPSAARLSPSAH